MTLPNLHSGRDFTVCGLIDKVEECRRQSFFDIRETVIKRTLEMEKVTICINENLLLVNHGFSDSEYYWDFKQILSMKGVDPVYIGDSRKLIVEDLVYLP